MSYNEDDVQTGIAKGSFNPILTYFKYDHLPPALQVVSKPFGDLAFDVSRTLPTSAETTTCLRKLLEAKDCAVRAALPPGKARI